MELMSEFISSAKSRALIAGAFSAAVFVCLAAAQTNTSTPDFSSGGVAWTVGPAYADFIAVPGSPSPITPDPAHPYVNNLVARFN